LGGVARRGRLGVNAGHHAAADWRGGLGLLYNPLPRVRRGDAFADAFQRMQECACPALPVVDDAGRFVGLITPENVGELMGVQAPRGEGKRPVWRGVGR